MKAKPETEDDEQWRRKRRESKMMGLGGEGWGQKTNDLNAIVGDIISENRDSP